MGGWAKKLLRAGVATFTRGSLNVHACMHARLDMRSCTNAKRSVFFGCVNTLSRARSEVPPSKLGGTAWARRTSYPPGALHTPSNASSVDAVFQIMHRLVGRVVGVRGGLGEDVRDGCCAVSVSNFLRPLGKGPLCKWRLRRWP